MLEIRDIHAGYGTHIVLDSVSFSVPDESITVILGRNSSGKSTLISCINQMMKYRGQILLDGVDIAALSPARRAQQIALLPQLLPSPAITVRELVSLGRSPYRTISHESSAEDVRLVDESMKLTDVFHLQSQRVDQISGGERQLVYLAMILAQNTNLLILDEPTSFMDISHEGRFLELLSGLSRNQKKSILLVVHNLSMAVRYADRIIILDHGKTVFQGSRADCLAGEEIERCFSVKRHSICEGDTEYLFFSPQ